MKLGKSEIGKDLLRSESGKDDGPLQGRVEILSSGENCRIFLFPDDQGVSGEETTRGLTILRAARLVFKSEELIEKVRQEELEFKDIAASMWPHTEDNVTTFRPEVGIIPVHQALDGLDRPMSLLRGTFVAITSVEWHQTLNGYLSNP